MGLDNCAFSDRNTLHEVVLLHSSWSGRVSRTVKPCSFFLNSLDIFEFFQGLVVIGTLTKMFLNLFASLFLDLRILEEIVYNHLGEVS